MIANLGRCLLRTCRPVPNREWVIPGGATVRCGRLYCENRGGRKDLIVRVNFSAVKDKTKDSYLEMVNVYKETEKTRRRHVDFIYAALKHMKEFGVERDLEVYKALVDVFPKGKLIPKNMIQAEFMHYPKEQQCAIDLLEQMEEYAVIPDWQMEQQLLNVFGKRGYPVRRYWRMMYWMPKFKNASPWLLPDQLPNEALELAILGVKRMTSVDPATEVTVFYSSDVKDSVDDTWIVSGQSCIQRNLIEGLPDKTPLFVEGRFRLWLREASLTYFVLRAEILTKPEKDKDYDDVTDLKLPLFSKPESLPKRSPSVHEQEDGMILGVCSTGTSSRDSVLSWIRCLQQTNPRLADLPVVFKLKAPVEEETNPATVEQTTTVKTRADSER